MKIAVALALLILAALPKAGTNISSRTPTQTARWNAAQVNPKERIRLDKAVQLYLRNRGTYGQIEAMRRNGVPAQVVFCLHYRESDNDFTANPAQGDPLSHKTVNVPRGRIPGKNPPYTFLQAAEDAYYTVDRLDLKNWHHLESALEAIELFNGPGYRNRGVPSPYVYAGTSIYTSGKFVSDGRYSAAAIDKQLGVAAILKRMQERGVWKSFE